MLFIIHLDIDQNISFTLLLTLYDIDPIVTSNLLHINNLSTFILNIKSFYKLFCAVKY